MPIDDDLKEEYPERWEAIRAEVLERATPDPDRVPWSNGRPCCERCAKPNHDLVYSFRTGWEALLYDVDEPHEPIAWLSVDTDGAVDEFQWLDDVADETRFLIMFGLRPEHFTKVVLTIAHTCQDPRCDDLNHLEALCQRCHLQLDVDQRGRRERIKSEIRGQRTLFGGGGCAGS